MFKCRIKGAHLFMAFCFDLMKGLRCRPFKSKGLSRQHSPYLECSASRYSSAQALSNPSWRIERSSQRAALHQLQLVEVHVHLHDQIGSPAPQVCLRCKGRSSGFSTPPQQQAGRGMSPSCGTYVPYGSCRAPWAIRSAWWAPS